MADAARAAAEAALEPAAVDFSTNDEERVGLSIAISLKRIADAIAPTEGLGAMDKLNEVLTDFTNNLYSTILNARN